MAILKLKDNDRFTYADYLAWPDEERWELIDGEAYNMSPGPGMRHQGILIHLASKFYSHLEGKPCQAFVAPFDVRPLAGHDTPDDEVDTVVQPDLLVVCDAGKLEERGVAGAPDLVVEILSPHTARKDLSVKFSLYERAGVREYWIIYPMEQIFQIYRLHEGRYPEEPEAFTPGKAVEVPWLDDFRLDVSAVFAG